MNSTEIDNFDTTEYLNQFDVMGKTDKFDNDAMIHTLYMALVNKFNMTLDEDQYTLFSIYQEKFYDLMENLIELDVKLISKILSDVHKESEYLSNIIIMSWCLPRAGKYCSKMIYRNKYKQNIRDYNSKLVQLITTEPVANFCIDTLSKKNYVPVHCIDYLWYYMNSVTLILQFYNYDSGANIGITPHADHDGDTCIYLGFNMEYMLEFGLGKVNYFSEAQLNNTVTSSQSKGSFRMFLINILTNEDIVKNYLSINTSGNYKRQAVAILRNSSKYLDLLSDDEAKAALKYFE